MLGRAWGGLSGYIPLRNEGRSQEEEAYFALSVSYMGPGNVQADDAEMGEVSLPVGL